MTEQHEPVSALHLEQAMVENTRSDTSETRVKVYQELLFSDLMLALSDSTPEDAAGGDAAGVPPVGESTPQQLNIALLTNPQGVKFAAVFTGPQAIRRWRPQGGQYATMRGQDIFKLLEPSPADVIVVNPGSAPLVALPKAEFRQLAAGIVPKVARSPVQVPASDQDPNAAADADGQQPPQNSLQISFPPNVFTDAQKQRTVEVLNNHENVIAAAVGAILPPNAPKDTQWIRTVFLRIQGVEPNQDELKKFCFDLREQIKDVPEIFADCQFEVGVMPDPKFWESLHKNQLMLLDKQNEILPPSSATDNVIPFNKSNESNPPTP